VPTTEHYDVVIIGSGAGGGTLAWKLAPSGKRILLLERGGYLPRERDNWDTTEVFLKGKYSTDEEWRDRKGDDWDYPFGAIQMLGKSDGIQLRAMAPRHVKWGAKLTPEMSLDQIALHGVDFWLSAEDLPEPDNRLTIDDDGTPRLALNDENNMEPLKRLRKKFESMLSDLGMEEGSTAETCTSTRGWRSRPPRTRPARPSSGAIPNRRSSTSTARPTSSTTCMSSTRASSCPSVP
jgi:hypothetical protein